MNRTLKLEQNNNELIKRSDNIEQEQNEIKKSMKIIENENYELINKTLIIIEEKKNEVLNITNNIKKEKEELKNRIIIIEKENYELINKTLKIEEEKNELIININNIVKDKEELKSRIIIIENENYELINRTNKLEEEDNKLKNEINKSENEINELKNIKNEINYLELRINDREKEKYERNKYYNNLFKESKIINEEERKLISKWVLPYYNLKFELLYSGSRDGFSTNTFHSKCDNKGPTLFVTKLENNRRFGGFASSSWGKDSHEIKDDNAFLFSLDNKIKYGLKKKGIDALYGQENTSVLFGPNYSKGDDLPIGGDIAYCRTEGLKFNFVKTDLCGEIEQNKMVEFEVYSVKNYIN